MINALKYFWYALNAPGYASLWLSFYWPTEWGKKRNVSKTGRQWRNRHVMAPIHTVSWLLLLMVLW